MWLEMWPAMWLEMWLAMWLQMWLAMWSGLSLSKLNGGEYEYLANVHSIVLSSCIKKYLRFLKYASFSYRNIEYVWFK